MSTDDVSADNASTSTRPDVSVATYRTLWRLAPYARAHRRPLIIGAVLIITANVCGLAIPVVIQRIIDGPLAENRMELLVPLTGVLLLLGVAESSMFWLRHIFIIGPSTDIEKTLRTELYNHLQRLPISFHDRWPSGQLLSRASTDVDTIGRFFRFTLLWLAVGLASIAVGFGVLIAISPLLGLVFILINLPMFVISKRLEKRYADLSVTSQEQEGDLATGVEESVLGIRVLKALGRGPHKSARFTEGARRLWSTERRKLSVLSRLMAAIIAIPELGVAGMLAVGVPLVASGSITVGELVAAVTLARYLLWPILALGWLLTETGATAAATQRYLRIIDTSPTITSPDHPVTAHGPGLVRLRDVRFSHGGREILRGVDLELRPGETVALVGATGSGKTTLTTLIARLHDVTGGSVTIDGVDVRDFDLTRLRATVATAFEEPVLFSASVRENVRLGRPDATDEEIREALRVAAATSFVDELPFGLDTRVGEEGLTLSGGQRQRLALARAVVGRPSVLVLDDPLSALDVHTEAEVERALRGVLSEVTALVVAHRPSTVALADRVAVLIDGRIIATGTHTELLADCPEYATLLNATQPEPTRA